MCCSWRATHSFLWREKEWPSFKGHTNIRSWLCVPLVASQQTLGLLSVGHTQPNTFTPDHLRRTQLLAIPAAAAIQNSRLYERAEIFGSELQRRLTDLRQTEKALEQSEEGRRVAERLVDLLSQVRLNGCAHATKNNFARQTHNRGNFENIASVGNTKQLARY